MTLGGNKVRVNAYWVLAGNSEGKETTWEAKVYEDSP